VFATSGDSTNLPQCAPLRYNALAFPDSRATSFSVIRLEKLLKIFAVMPVLLGGAEMKLKISEVEK
jgi:hypothetical protein